MIASDAVVTDFSSNRVALGKGSASRKLRTFQTFLSDAELSSCKLLFMAPPANENLWSTMLDTESEKLFPNMPLLHRMKPLPKPKIEDGNEVNHIEPQNSEWTGHFSNRIENLREVASDEGYVLSEESAHSAREFLNISVFSNLPSIFLASNGNVRLVWRNSEGEQIGLQFRDSNEVQYVIFRTQGETVENIMGTMQSANILALIDALGMNRLMLEND